ncbi:MAG: ferrochelatase [Nitrospiraceae bacterium]|nr:MAG: ferrochelatase [Nitrospiraceae bacterium]
MRANLTGRKKEITGVILLNLGGPDSLKAVRPFLYNLFSDREIIRLGPSFMQRPIAWLISTLRSKKTEAMYSRIGGKSPILDITRSQAVALEKALNNEAGIRSPGTGGDSSLRFKVYVGMRYWHPFMEEAFKKIISDGVHRLIVLSLYPHYSKATTGSSVSDFKKAIEGQDLTTQYIEQWYDFPQYIDALAELVAKGIERLKGNEFDLLYSAHSLPQSFIDEGDPYLDHIKTTIEKVNKRLAAGPYNINVSNSRLSFQSKTGPVKWLGPSTEETIINLSKGGCRNLLVVPISFVSDHIETLYEIDILYKGFAAEHGINLIRCDALNTSEKFIHAMKELVLASAGHFNRQS